MTNTSKRQRGEYMAPPQQEKLTTWQRVALLARYDSLKIELDNIIHLLRDNDRQITRQQLNALIKRHHELLEESYEIE